VHGIGISKYVQLQAIFEVSRHALNEQMQVKEILNSPKQVRDYLCLKLGNLTREVFLVLFLDAQYKVVKTQEMFSGTLTQASIYP
jgi:DNA repair protein RadC